MITHDPLQDVLTDLSAQPAVLMTNKDGVKFYAHKVFILLIHSVASAR